MNRYGRDRPCVVAKRAFWLVAQRSRRLGTAHALMKNPQSHGWLGKQRLEPERTRI